MKIIDFGIANPIADDTVNVHREHQVGTPNYMAPEALLDTKTGPGSLGKGEKLIKIGKPSDIWSLGCILYQMAYGKAPFVNIQNHFKRAMAIVNPDHVIQFHELDFASTKVPTGLIRTLKTCLQREQTQRPTTFDLLSSSDPFLYPDHAKSAEADITQDQIGSIIRSVVKFCESERPAEDELSQLSDTIFHRLRVANARCRQVGN
ncbi:hypothetical protein AJ80_06918 [Polytolypa hystricis UAMH7299]|uniref:Protein kinase domain-containing protein n=1 Tax=Polytolypa hystricis (strain UAMH7299) TaxID=1447883 RepID=A0A2B7XTH6_POLH7|nr:hypothetical protein AJ80_06918 [Polytolypa hystricis UAMH7299]